MAFDLLAEPLLLFLDDVAQIVMLLLQLPCELSFQRVYFSSISLI
jgi:hypothetical protein